MSEPACRPVVVGIDGSRASLNAAEWAVAEAVQRDVPLRLVHAEPAHEGPTALVHRNTCDVDMALLSAEDAVICAGKQVRVELARIAGEPTEVLVCESHCAAMVCIGAAAPNPSTGRFFRPTAAALLEWAQCPVAVIRIDADGAPRNRGVVAVVLNDEPDNDTAVHLAMQEGRLRRTTVRQIDPRLNSWIRRSPDVPVQVVASGCGQLHLRGGNDETDVQLAVVGEADAAGMVALAVPNCHPIVGYPDCSVLMFRSAAHLNGASTRSQSPPSTRSPAPLSPAF